MRISARNQLKDKIIEINEGAVNGIVKIDIGHPTCFDLGRRLAEYGSVSLI